MVGMDAVALDSHLRLNNMPRGAGETMPSLETRVEALESERLATARILARLESSKPELERLVFSPRVVVWLVTAAVSVFGGIWASTYGLRSDVRDILTHMSFNETLQTERSKATVESIDQMKRRQELQQYEIQDLEKTILRRK